MNKSMMYNQTTQVPNELFDKHLPELTEAELKIVLVIIRQTYGWINLKTGRRKIKDRISHSQFLKKTKLCRRVISNSIKTLVEKGIVGITDYKGNSLNNSMDRKGRNALIYSFLPEQNLTIPCADKCTEDVHKGTYNKTNYTKINKTKIKGVRHISEYLV